MAINFNGQIIPVLPEISQSMLRATQYGDSLFETIRMFDGRIPFLESHIQRLKNGMELIGLETPQDWDSKFFESAIRMVAEKNARIRLMVWRSPGGLYRPENHQPQFMVTSVPLESPAFVWPNQPLTIGICQKVRLPVDDFSAIKTFNAPRYTQAAIEAQKNGWDDGILLNQFGQICEATSSNIFWWDENGTLCTPALSTGCVAGVMRDHIIATAKNSGIQVALMETAQEDLIASKEIFLTNAIRGIIPAVLMGQYPGAFELTGKMFEAISVK